MNAMGAFRKRKANEAVVVPAKKNQIQKGRGLVQKGKQHSSPSPVKLKVVEGRLMFDRAKKQGEQIKKGPRQSKQTNKNDNRTQSEETIELSPHVTRSVRSSKQTKLTHPNGIAEYMAEVEGLKLSVNASEDEEFEEQEIDDNQEQTSQQDSE